MIQRTDLGMPSSSSAASGSVGVRTSRQAPAGVSFTGGHHFSIAAGTDPEQLAQEAKVPLSVIVQVTKRCNFDCSFCSEVLQLPDPSMNELARMRDNLAGVSRVFLSGGEPLMRRDFPQVVDTFAGQHIIGVPTNATRGVEHAAALLGRVDFVNVGLEGPRATTNRVRGDYDQVMTGIAAFRAAGLPLSLSAVVGVDIDPAQARFVTVIHHRNPAGETRVGFFFATSTWTGDVINAEPHKCAGLLWADPGRPPANTIGYTVAALTALRAGSPFALDGWATTGTDVGVSPVPAPAHSSSARSKVAHG